MSRQRCDDIELAPQPRSVTKSATPGAFIPYVRSAEHERGQRTVTWGQPVTPGVAEVARASVARLQPRVHRLGLQRQYGEHALVDPPQRLAARNTFERLEPERVLPTRE
jgi:hypothetical protein